MKKTENRTSKIDILLHHGMYIYLDKIRGQNVLVCIVLILYNKKSSKIWSKNRRKKPRHIRTRIRKQTNINISNKYYIKYDKVKYS